MATEIILPHLGESIAQATLLKWRYQPGDAVERGDVLGEVETDKATLELECPRSGVLLDIVVHEGEQATVGQVLAAVGKEGERWEPEDPERTESEPASRQEQFVSDAVTQAEEPDDERDDRRRVSPFARRLARELGVDIQRVHPAKPGARITKEDVERHATNTAKTAESRTDRLRKLPTSEAAEPSTAGQRVPLTKTRRIVADRMARSAQTIPQFSVTVDVESDQLEETRRTLESRSGIRASLTALLVVLTSRAIREHPWLNSRFAGDALIVHEHINIAVAVATPDGLVAPVLQEAERLDLDVLARRLDKLVESARDGRLHPEDISGATFTISNLGMLGATHFVPLVNPPQVAILAVGTSRPRLVLDREQDSIQQVHSMSLTVSADHRALDGETVARFLGTLKQRIETCTVDQFAK